MTTELSDPSCTEGSAQILSPCEIGNDEGPNAKEPEQSGEAAATSSPSPSLIEDSSRTAEKEMAVVRQAESQPMTASNSTSSTPSIKDVSGNGTGGAAPYGTRSRNRTGSSRPNYAEDKELDAEFEIAPSAKDHNGRKAGRGADPNPVGSLDSGRMTNASRKSALLEDDQIFTTQGHHKDVIPGTSTFSANPTPPITISQPSKKRKAAGLPPTTITQPQLQVSAQTTATAQAVTRRASMAAQVVAGFRETNMLSFENCSGRLKNKRLVADDGTILEVNDHVYLVCEPPGEPYYLGRIMEFLHVNNDNTQPIDALRLNWYYRPKDIGRKVNDTRQVFASMHSDISPLTALRGKCQIKHKSEVDRLDDLRKTKDCFWYEKLYDRYIHRFYDVIPTNQVINVPVEVKKVLDERWKYIIVEPSRGKELTSAVKSCKRCNKYCASNDSVDCAVCQSTYHMSCVNPPLLKKPSRGFAWACGPCSKAQEKKLEARNTPNITDATVDGEDDEFNDDEEDFPGDLGDTIDTGRTSPTGSSQGDLSIHPGTAEQIHQASLWLFRYLGIYCKVEDALDYDDRIYPRASSRLGPRHQANLTMWPGRPVEYVKPAEIKRKYVKGSNHKKDAKFSRETIAALEADKIAREKRPKWVMDEPPGYIERGGDLDNDDPNNTAELLFKPLEVGDISLSTERGADDSTTENLDITKREQLVQDYMDRARQLAKPLGLPEFSTNLLDVALQLLHSNEYDSEKAIQALHSVDKKIFNEPDLSPAEIKKFEDGVAKYGSEWHSIKKHVKSVSAANIVRFYYTWKKTERGKQIWGNYSGRKGKKEAKKADTSGGKLQDDVADEYDDSAFDNDKAFEKKRGFQCKFCSTRSSRRWRRAPNTPPGTMILENPNTKAPGKDRSTQLMVALCRRCAELWRRYAIQWEDIDEVAKKVAQAGGRAWKRKIDEEVLKELVAANEVMNQAANFPPMATTSAGGTPVPMLSLPAGLEQPRKKLKGLPERDTTDQGLDSGVTTPGQQKRRLAVEKPSGPPPAPELPKPRILPCSICDQMDPLGDQHLSCKECRMTVHRSCYGVVGENRSPSKWVCDMCSNDKNPQVSIQYKCMLCPVEHTEQDFVEPPRATHKKKNEKERERDRVERETAQKVADFFRRKQEELNKPINPREPLKRTANNNWVHVTCAVFTPEVKFGNAKALEPSEGVPSIASARYDEVCRACRHGGGACVACHSCKAPVHVECAHQAGFILGFDIAPVKGSRRDQFSIVNINGEVGTMTAAIWCKEHVPTKTIVHRMHDIVDDTGLNALQLYVQNFKQADLTLTGTVRKATLVNQSTKVVNPMSVTITSNRRTSTTMSIPNGRGSVSHFKAEEGPGEGTSISGVSLDKTCVTCGIDVSPKWWPCHPSLLNSASIVHIDNPVGSNGDYSRLNETTLTNGHVSRSSLGESGGGHVALAAAALHQNTQKVSPSFTEFQCHQCHWRKVRTEPSPLQAAPPRDPSRAPVSTQSALTMTTPDAELIQNMPQYAWPQPPAYPSNGPYNPWSRQSPTPQNVPMVNQLNGTHSPRVSAGSIQQLNGQSQLRQPVQGLPLSPHQDGLVAQAPNGYPPSPHRAMGSSAIHVQNNAYPSYGSTRPGPQHLTNGGPPPRAAEHPFSQGSASMQHRSSFGQPQPQGSPSMRREAHPQGRDLGNAQNNGVRQNDGRVNGGASASPSLRNLLS